MIFDDQTSRLDWEVIKMWRALFLAIGIFTCLVGLECLAIEKAVFASLGRPPQQQQQQSADPFGLPTGLTADAPRGKEKKEVVPPDWAPWGLLAAGAVVIIYSFTIPRRVRN